MSAELLRQALRVHDIDADVGTDGAVAFIRLLRDDARLADAGFRKALVALAATHGFRNMALEVD